MALGERHSLILLVWFWSVLALSQLGYPAVAKGHGRMEPFLLSGHTLASSIARHHAGTTGIPQEEKPLGSTEIPGLCQEFCLGKG